MNGIIEFLQIYSKPLITISYLPDKGLGLYLIEALPRLSLQKYIRACIHWSAFKRSEDKKNNRRVYTQTFKGSYWSCRLGIREEL